MLRQCAAVLAMLLGITNAPASNLHGRTWDRPSAYLTNAHISLIYWGAAWVQPTTRPSRRDFTAALRDIVNGPWSSQLRQYHQASASSIDQVITYTGTDPPARFTNRDMNNFLEARINRNQVAAPAPHTPRIYTILLPTSSDADFTGFHLYYMRDNSAPIYLTWILNDGTLTGANSIPKTFSHELAETLTDADGRTGQHVLTGTHERDEIADVCNVLYKTVNGHAEQAYWSIADHRCVLPTASSSLAQPRQPQPLTSTQANYTRRTQHRRANAASPGSISFSGALWLGLQ
jgi:hypothetical protein